MRTILSWPGSMPAAKSARRTEHYHERRDADCRRTARGRDAAIISPERNRIQAGASRRAARGSGGRWLVIARSGQHRLVRRGGADARHSRSGRLAGPLSDREPALAHLRQPGHAAAFRPLPRRPRLPIEGMAVELGPRSAADRPPSESPRGRRPRAAGNRAAGSVIAPDSLHTDIGRARAIPRVGGSHRPCIGSDGPCAGTRPERGRSRRAARSSADPSWHLSDLDDDRGRRPGGSSSAPASRPRPCNRRA